MDVELAGSGCDLFSQKCFASVAATSAVTITMTRRCSRFVRSKIFFIRLRQELRRDRSRVLDRIGNAGLAKTFQTQLTGIAFSTGATVRR